MRGGEGFGKGGLGLIFPFTLCDEMGTFHQGTCVSIKNTLDSLSAINGAISLGLDEDSDNDPMEDIDGENKLSPLGAQYCQMWGQWERRG